MLGIDFNSLAFTGIPVQLFPIVSKYGHNLDGLRVLQIGSGPEDSGSHTEGPKLDLKLRELGASVSNLDLNPCSSFYSQSRFIQGDWFNLGDLLSDDGVFDIMFASKLEPTLGRESMSESLLCSLLGSTLDILSENMGPSLFYVHGRNVGDLRFSGEKYSSVAREKNYSFEKVSFPHDFSDSVFGSEFDIFQSESK